MKSQCLKKVEKFSFDKYEMNPVFYSQWIQEKLWNDNV